MQVAQAMLIMQKTNAQRIALIGIPVFKRSNVGLLLPKRSVAKNIAT